MTELKEKIAKERNEALDIAGRQVKDAILKFLADFPAVEKIKFQSYTPGFNDGDPCKVTISGPYIKLTEATGNAIHPDRERDEDEDGFLDIYDLERDSAMHKAAGELSDVLGVWPEAVEHVFGESQEVVIDQEGTVETEDYSCGW